MYLVGIGFFFVLLGAALVLINAHSMHPSTRIADVDGARRGIFIGLIGIILLVARVAFDIAIAINNAI